MRLSLQKIILIFACVFVGQINAQEDNWYIGKTISKIKFEGLQSISENELNPLIRPYIGLEYTDSISWEIQSTLYALDYFDLITPKVRTDGARIQSIVIIFQVQEKPVTDAVLFEGNSKIRRGELLNTVLIKKGDLLNTSTVELDEQTIVDLYIEKGFISAKVSSEYNTDEENNSVTVLFKITEGTQTKIKKINFAGNEQSFSDSKLLSQMKTKAQSLFSKGLFVEIKLQEDIKRIESYYHARGYIDAKVLDIKKDIIFDKKQNANTMEITIVISEGYVWFYQGISLSGNEIYSHSELEALIFQKPGDVLNLTRFQTDYQRITDLYFENGYIFNTFSYNEVRDEENRSVSYEIQIQERGRAHIENIVIRGNYKTKSYIIRREIPLDEGEVFSKAKILEGLRNLYNLRYFEVVDPKPYPGDSDGLMDLVVDVSESRSTDIILGLAFSGGVDFPISGQVKWTDRNFLGRGQILGANTSISLYGQKVTLSFTEPRLLGKRWSGGINFTWRHSINSRINQDLDGNGLPDPYNSWEEYNSAGRIAPTDKKMQYESHQLSTGFNTGYAWSTPIGTLGFTTGYQFGWKTIIYDSNLHRPQSKAVRDNHDNWIYNDSVSLGLYWDTRDLKFDATRGIIISQRFIISGILPLSTTYNIKSISRVNYNLLLLDIPTKNEERPFRVILYMNSAFQALLDQPGNINKSDENIDGFYIDGMFIARGWKPNSGYRYLWDNTVQIKFPIIRNVLSFDLFFDAVGTWRSTAGLNNMKASDWRFALGGGLRFANPQFPIGIYLVKKFKFDADGKIDWAPEAKLAEISDWGMDLVIAFDLDIY